MSADPSADVVCVGQLEQPPVSLSLYFPATHAPHGPPASPSYPSSHVQLRRVVEARGDEEYKGHERQACDPETFLKVFSSHAPQGPPSGPVYPALHVQFSADTAAGADEEFPAHPAHA